MKFICGFDFSDSDVIEADCEKEAMEIYVDRLKEIIDKGYLQREVWVEDYEELDE